MNQKYSLLAIIVLPGWTQRVNTGGQALTVETVCQTYAEQILAEYVQGKYAEKIIPSEITTNWVGLYDEALGHAEIVKGIVEPLRYMFSMKSKGFRVVLAAVTGFELGTPEEQAMQIGAFVEALHNASLMVDDIEDNSTKRRGMDCCHIKYGIPHAIDAGNTIYFLAMRWIFDIQDPETRRKALEIAVREMTNLHLGQNQDIVWNQGVMGDNYEYSEEGYFTLCRHKTAGLLRIVAEFCSLLSSQPLSKEGLADLIDLYNGIGVLFQVVDDILNLEPSTVAANKAAAAEDIREGNKTIIAIHTMKHGTPADAKRLREILSTKRQPESMTQEGLEIVRRSGSIDYAKTVAKNMAAELHKKTDKVMHKPKAKEIIHLLIDYILNRKN